MSAWLPRGGDLWLGPWRVVGVVRCVVRDVDRNTLWFVHCGVVTGGPYGCGGGGGVAPGGGVNTLVRTGPVEVIHTVTVSGINTHKYNVL